MSALDLFPEVRDLVLATQVLADYEAPDPEQARVRERMLAFIAEHPHDAHLRSCLEGHLTGSCLLLDHGGERALLTHHRKLDRWLQLGGHCDGDANLVRVALREVIEESGIEELVIDPTPVDLDIHEIPARPGEPEHLHLDTRFVARAAADTTAAASSESHAVRWFSPGELALLDLDDSLRRLVRIAFGRPR